MKTVIFTGGGASKADGVPLQAELFSAFFSKEAPSEGTRRLMAAVRLVLDSICSRCGLSGNPYPTFEEVLAMLELGLAREEGIRQLQSAASLDLVAARRHVILAMAVAIAQPEGHVGRTHSQLIDNLRADRLIDDITFITTNYDMLLDGSIEDRAVHGERGTGSIVDYGLGGLTAHEESDFDDLRRFPCLKVHGSLNWLLCEICDTLDITYGVSGVIRLVDDPGDATCTRCGALRTPLIIPPTYLKNMSRVHIGAVWSRAFRALQAADQVVFCGYSFPDADFHVKYLLKRAQLNRDTLNRPLAIKLVNSFRGKAEDAIASEVARYTRFLGAGAVRDTGISFEEFASAPSAIITL